MGEAARSLLAVILLIPLHHLIRVRALQVPPIPSIALPKFRLTYLTYLVLNDALLEPRSAHSNLSGLLAPAPDAFTVGSLLLPQLLGFLDALLQDLVERALGGSSGGIGLGYGLHILARDGVVGGHFGLLLRRVGGPERRLGQTQGAARTEGSGEHCVVWTGARPATAAGVGVVSYDEVVGVASVHAKTVM